ncbi:serine/threonine protein kinase [Nonomuraea angiospora]|uniref:Ser/Thr protein kinase n=1 Tax=Nonomuraea angiospora TaxID=46172 RepID=A0ABR9M200_9ACTN|nr:serine/threonine-protein kinase [Nonomuraea angiospora]MBE1586938.1 putative Ser/Thr protein kinase [Nonomuraea angiospora]
MMTPEAIGPYRVVKQLGEGGQGVVYLATAPDGTPVAVKALHEGLPGDGRFAKEIAAARRVEPFCIAQVLDASLGGPRPYIVTEYVEGPSLHQAGRHSGADLQRLAVATATALAAIHRAGVVHRDFKPANVLLGRDGPRVIDFGIARAMDAALTRTSSVVGTPAYMAPEQFMGAAAGPAVDVFAWGAVMVYAATGAPPFGNDSVPAVLRRIQYEEPQLGGVPEPLRSIVYACLAKDPAARPAMHDVLFQLIGGQAPPPSPGGPAGPPASGSAPLGSGHAGPAAFPGPAASPGAAAFPGGPAHVAAPSPAYPGAAAFPGPVGFPGGSAHGAGPGQVPFPAGPGPAHRAGPGQVPFPPGPHGPGPSRRGPGQYPGGPFPHQPPIAHLQTNPGRAASGNGRVLAFLAGGTAVVVTGAVVAAWAWAPWWPGRATTANIVTASTPTVSDPGTGAKGSAKTPHPSKTAKTPKTPKTPKTSTTPKATAPTRPTAEPTVSRTTEPTTRPSTSKPTEPTTRPSTSKPTATSGGGVKSVTFRFEGYKLSDCWRNDTNIWATVSATGTYSYRWLVNGQNQGRQEGTASSKPLLPSITWKGAGTYNVVFEVVTPTSFRKSATVKICSNSESWGEEWPD